MCRIRTLAFLLAPLLVPGLAGAAEPPCEFDGIPRVVAVGDVHGSYDGFVQVLQMAGLIDGGKHWTGGTAHLVQTGDVPDRGPKSREVVELLTRLERDAERAGGRVHTLLGNHEVMNLMGDLRYVSAEEYEAFRTSESERRRERHYRNVLREARRRAEEKGESLDVGEFRTLYLKEIPLGYLEHREAWGPDGPYGRWTRSRRTVVKVNGVVFVHGGLTPEVAALGCAGINATVHRELNEDYEKTRKEPLQTLVAGEAGPLWYRGLAREDEATLGPKLDQVLAALGARAVVIGHTPTRSGRIEARAGGRVVMIDAGMGTVYGDHRAALEITPQRMMALYPEGRQEMTAHTPERRAPVPAAAPAAP
jgi:hypothetical protein